MTSSLFCARAIVDVLPGQKVKFSTLSFYHTIVKLSIENFQNFQNFFLPQVYITPHYVNALCQPVSTIGAAGRPFTCEDALAQFLYAAAAVKFWYELLYKLL